MEGLDLPSDGSIVAFTAEERPDLWVEARSLLKDVWPEYNNHGNDSGTYFGALFPEYAHLQILFFDRETEQVLARGRTIPFRWDGSLDDLPNGIDAVGLRAVEGPQVPTALSALAAEVAIDHQGLGLSRAVLEAMVEVARQAGLSALVAPVRPNRKDRYPLIPIERYAYWVRGDALPFDPWQRVHSRLGATILRPEPRSLRIEGPVSDWEVWTDMKFPEDGEYTFPLGLAPLQVHDGVGSYWEPNVWMIHDV